MKKCILRWIPALTIMVLIFIASATPGDEVPVFETIDLVVKKGGHMIGYALLAAACFFAARRGNSNMTRSLVLSLSLTIIYAVSDEYHQSFTPGRSPSITDIGIDAAGAVIGAAVSVYIVRRRLSLRRAD